MLPSDFPNWQIVYYYFTAWSEADEDGISTLDRVLKKLVQMVRNESLKKDKITLGIIDSKSIKNVDTTEKKGYDAGKKISGIKLHIVVDTLDLPHAVHVTCADVTDRKGAKEMIGLHIENLSSVKKFVVDGGYSGEKFSNMVREKHVEK